jgi:hypothetical protein
MRTTITLASLGLTLALGGAVVANPVDRYAQPLDRYAFLERTTHANEQIQNYFRHKKYYKHDQRRGRGEGSGTSRSQDQRNRDGVGTAPPEVRKPVLRQEPAVLRGPGVRVRFQADA